MFRVRRRLQVEMATKKIYKSGSSGSQPPKSWKKLDQPTPPPLPGFQSESAVEMATKPKKIYKSGSSGSQPPKSWKKLDQPTPPLPGFQSESAVEMATKPKKIYKSGSSGSQPPKSWKKLDQPTPPLPGFQSESAVEMATKPKKIYKSGTLPPPASQPSLPPPQPPNHPPPQPPNHPPPQSQSKRLRHELALRGPVGPAHAEALEVRLASPAAWPLGRWGERAAPGCGELPELGLTLGLVSKHIRILAVKWLDTLGLESKHFQICLAANWGFGFRPLNHNLEKYVKCSQQQP